VRYPGRAPAFFAIVYERIVHTETSETWKAVRVVRFVRRKDAHARAYKWYQDDCRHRSVGTYGLTDRRVGYCKVCAKDLPAPRLEGVSPSA
jgi:hypothetical protein